MISIRLRELAEKRNGPVVATAIALRVERALFGLARLVPGLDRHATGCKCNFPRIDRRSAGAYAVKHSKSAPQAAIRKAKYPHGRLHSKKKYYNVATSILF